MLHLLPLRSLGRFALAVTVLGVLAVILISSPTQGTTLAKGLTILRWALAVEGIVALFVFYCWYRLPGLTKRYLFPHIEGSWDGELQFKQKRRSGDTYASKPLAASKPAKLYIHQSLTRIRLILETDESTSETLVVHPERDPNFSRFRLFYIFENRSRDGQPNNGRSYRGTAVMEVPPGRPSELRGTYFTDQGSEGTFVFVRRGVAVGWLRSLWDGFFGEKGAAAPVVAVPRDHRALDIN